MQGRVRCKVEFGASDVNSNADVDMEVKTFRARSVQEALARVRQELGDEAAVLQTREVGRGWWNWLTGQSDVEVTAATEVTVPRRASLCDDHVFADGRTRAEVGASFTTNSDVSPRDGGR